MVIRKIVMVGLLVLLLVVMIPTGALTNQNNKGSIMPSGWYLNLFEMFYIYPSRALLNGLFTYPLPSIEGLEKAGDFLIQAEFEDTFSTNIISKYTSDTLGISLIEIYKNTQNKKTGIFLRILGGISVVKPGYPKLITDTPLLNIDYITGEPADLYGFQAVNLPQATEEQQDVFWDSLTEKVEADGIIYMLEEYEDVPEFWGPQFMAPFDGLDFETIERIRNHAWSAYQDVIAQTDAQIPYDYTPLQEFLILEMAGREGGLFEFLGLTVPAEAQSAFFSVVSAADPE